VERFADEVFGIGDYILTGGELASMVMSDAIARNIPNVLGNEDSLEMESFEESLLEAPLFTKPQNFRDFSFPLEFLKGNHGKIASLKRNMSILRTQYFRPDLYEKHKIKEVK
jgi:tRNA (guanine37-N1)-methyltransferase